MRTDMIKRLVFTIALLTLARSGFAQTEQQIRVSAMVSNNPVYVGDEVLYQIVIEGARSAARPAIAAPDGARIEFLGGQDRTQSFIRIINGRRTDTRSESFVLQYRLTPMRAGQIVVPAVEVEVGGAAYQTNPVTLIAREPATAAGFGLEITLDRSELFVGETVPLRVTWMLSDAARRMSFDQSEFPDSVLVEPPRVLGRTPGGRTYQFAFMGRDVVGQLGSAVVDGQVHSTLEFELDLTPTQAGEMQIGPVTVVFDRTNARGRQERTISRSPVLAVTVREPPTAGRPRGFTGLVGRFDLESMASPTTVNVGDPIELVVRITGREPMRLIRDAPGLDGLPEFDDFKLSADGWRGSERNVPGQRLFRTTIRARAAELEEIPPIELVYFDPELGEYRTTRSDPIAIDVRAVRQVTAADAIGGAELPMIERTPVELGEPGLWAEDRGGKVLWRESFSLTDRLTSPVWVSVLAAPPGAYGLLALIGWRRRARDPALVRQKRALRSALALDRRGQPGEAIRVYLAERRGIASSSVTAADIEALSVDEVLQAELASIIAQQEAGRFGAAGNGNRQHIGRQLRQLDRELGRSR